MKMSEKFVGNNFMYVSKSFIPYEYRVDEADVIFMGVPFSSTSVSSPSIYGPTLFRESMKLIEGCEGKKNIFDLKMVDIGNVEVVPGSYELTRQRIIQTVKDVRELNKRATLIFIGGEHLITLPIIEALNVKSIIDLDAHDDMRNDYMGNKYSHTTWAKRARDLGVGLVQYGVRSFVGKKTKTTLSDLKSRAGRLKRPVHITLDVDVLDIQYVTTGLPEPNGITPTELFKVIESVGKYASSMDIVEMSGHCLPSKTGIIAANAVKKFLVSKC